MNNVKRVIILLSACFSVLTIAAQTDSLVSFFKHEQSLLREKLYLHTDKPYYSAGDTLWFRGTLVNADTHSYLVKTNFIYVELLTATDYVQELQTLYDPNSLVTVLDLVNEMFLDTLASTLAVVTKLILPVCISTHVAIPTIF